ncbi:MAG TPA: hypothetical protein VHF27_01125 [Acidimicrobiales bacterium]|nr:hypothetical protein [Acidimicrobiales bacterium]
MPTSMLVSEHPLTPADGAEGPDGGTVAVPGPRLGGSRARRVVPVVAMVTGLVVMAVAVLVLTRAGDGDVPADPSAITLSARDVSVVSQVYEPGESSGWHSHPGIHAVSVTSGVLTVRTSGCPVRTFEPGRPYVGGQELHLVANETDAPVTMTVTYLNPSSPPRPGQTPAPASCPAD